MLFHQKIFPIISGLSLLAFVNSFIAMDEPFHCKVPVRQKNPPVAKHKKLQHNPAPDVDESGEDTILDVGKDIARSYMTMMVSNIIHEGGHALAELLLYQNTRGAIHIGQPDVSKSGLTLGGIVINSFNPLNGAAFCSDRTGITASSWKEIIKCFAGPLCGALWSYWHYKWLMKKYPNKYLLSKGTSLFMIFNNGENLIPSTNKAGIHNDGMQIYNAYKSMKKRKN